MGNKTTATRIHAREDPTVLPHAASENWEVNNSSKLQDQVVNLGPAYFTKRKIVDQCGNDPSAGSPTETLLRLHLPLNDKV